jgi:hypothetical protein
MQAHLQRNDLQNVLCLIKIAFSKLSLKMNFKILFYKVFFLNSKDCFSKPYFYFALCKQSSFANL